MLKAFFELLIKDKNEREADQKAQVGLSKLCNMKILSIGTHRVKIDRKIAEGGKVTKTFIGSSNSTKP